MPTPRTKEIMLAYNRRMFALLAMLVRERVVDMTKVSKIFSGSHVLALDAIRKLKTNHDINIQVYTRRASSATKLVILR